jgi:putative oxygen-independent coproporphyrinogen III oxidase
MEPTGLYVHLPFCRVRCSYCPFAVSTDLRLEQRYVNALIGEIGQLKPGAVDTLYFGGGTPSRSTSDSLSRLVAALRERFPIGRDCEFTLEANPEDIDEESLSLWASLGVNRLSIGIQSLEDRELYAIGRGHGRQRALSALALARGGEWRVSADLIIGLPHQTPGSFRASLKELLEQGIDHLSVYMLDLEEGTGLEKQVRRGVITLPPDEQVADLYLELVEVAQAAGLSQYEISNFSRPGFESRHNLRYWRHQSYRGLGLAAHSFDGSVRWANTAVIADYIARLEGGTSPREFSEQLSEENLRHERIFLALRQLSGMEYAALVALTGARGEEWTSRGVEEGWLRKSGERVGFTPRGFVLSSGLISQLF